MHETAKMNARFFRDNYCPQLGMFDIVEIGSLDVNGSIRDIFNGCRSYLGLDFSCGKGVDLIIDDPYKLPLLDSSADIVLCSSVMEHSEFFWLLFLEIMRILKPNGLLYLNVPSNGSFHRYPVDCWRFYPDSGNALVSWGRRNGYAPVLLESYIGDQENQWWNDFVGVILKCESFSSLYEKRITETYHNYRNGLKHGSEIFSNEVSLTQEQEIIKSLKRAKGFNARPPVLEDFSSNVAKSNFIYKFNMESIGLEKLDNLMHSEFLIRGWVLPKNNSQRISLLISNGGIIQSLKLNENRPDVIARVYDVEPTDHDLLMCGFNFKFLPSSVIKVGFSSGGESVWIKAIKFPQ